MMRWPDEGGSLDSEEHLHPGDLRHVHTHSSTGHRKSIVSAFVDASAYISESMLGLTAKQSGVCCGFSRHVMGPEELLHEAKQATDKASYYAARAAGLQQASPARMYAHDAAQHAGYASLQAVKGMQKLRKAKAARSSLVALKMEEGRVGVGGNINAAERRHQRTTTAFADDNGGGEGDGTAAGEKDTAPAEGGSTEAGGQDEAGAAEKPAETAPAADADAGAAKKDENAAAAEKTAAGADADAAAAAKEDPKAKDAAPAAEETGGSTTDDKPKGAEGSTDGKPAVAAAEPSLEFPGSSPKPKGGGDAEPDEDQGLSDGLMEMRERAQQLQGIVKNMRESFESEAKKIDEAGR
eukprot:g6100.t1